MEEAEVHPRSPLVPSPVHYPSSGVISSSCYLHSCTSFVEAHGSVFFKLSDTGQMQQSVLSTCLILSLKAALLNKARCNFLVGRFINSSYFWMPTECLHVREAWKKIQSLSPVACNRQPFDEGSGKLPSWCTEMMGEISVLTKEQNRSPRFPFQSLVYTTPIPSLLHQP